MILRGSFSVLLITCIVLAGQTASGHHSIAGTFDTTKTVTIKGTVTTVLWINPHVILLVKVTGANGQTETWALSGLAPNVLARQVDKEKFKEGMTVSTVAFPSRPGLTMATYAPAASNSAPVKGIVEAGDIELSTGEVLAFGRASNVKAAR